MPTPYSYSYVVARRLRGPQTFPEIPSCNRCLGEHVTLHGATRHTSAVLILENAGSDLPRPTLTTMLEVQGRDDAQTFQRHYCHTPSNLLQEALTYQWEPPPFHQPAGESSKPDDDDTMDGHQPAGESSKPENDDAMDGDWNSKNKDEVGLRNLATTATSSEKRNGTDQEEVHVGSSAASTSKRHASRNAFRKVAGESCCQFKCVVRKGVLFLLSVLSPWGISSSCQGRMEANLRCVML